MYSVRLRSGARHGETPRIGGKPKNQPISELDIFSKRQALSRAVVVNSNMSRGKYLAREGPGSRLRGTLSRLALRRDRASPWWFWKVCDFDVTGSCDVISPDHFVRGFYNSSFRRCGLNFLVLQKDSKILLHNLSIHEKLEQSTHWNILKKWGKDFTFGSGCTVTLKVKYNSSCGTDVNQLHHDHGHGRKATTVMSTWGSQKVTFRPGAMLLQNSALELISASLAAWSF